MSGKRSTVTGEQRSNAGSNSNQSGVTRRGFIQGVAATAGMSSVAGCLASSEGVAGYSETDDTNEGTTLSGTLLVGDDLALIEGSITIEDGMITEIEEQGVESDDIIIPAFFNAHTHITDSHAKEDARGFDWSELFVDPGLKSQLNENASEEEITGSMESTMELMYEGGTGAFVDFKEQGTAGVEDLETLDEETPVEAYTLLTGGGLGEGIDLRAEIEAADGYNSYAPYSDRDRRAREICRDLDKIFALHSGEPNADDITESLELEPDYTSHMVHTRPKDYGVLAEKDIGVCALPRSNMVILDELPPLEQLHAYTTVALGTDNVMLNSSSMFREMEFTSKQFDLSPKEILQMATINGARLAGKAEEVGSIEKGKRARMTVLSTDGELEYVEDEIAGIVRRAGVSDVKDVILQ